MLVTQIQAVTKQKYRVVIEGQPAFVIYRGELFRYKIKEGEELPLSVYQELTEKVLKKRAILRAMHILERSDKTKAELERKLIQSEYPRAAVEAALAYVESFGYINDKRYAQRYIESGKEKKGKARLKLELARKGISDSVIEEALEETEFEDARSVIREMMKKRRKGNCLFDEKEKRRLYGFFQRKGFSSSDILAVIREEEQKEEEYEK
ncbi:MAG: regulatory protein RecX [Blautia sp.]